MEKSKINIGHKLVMYGNAIFKVIQKYENFSTIPEDIFPKTSKTYWDFVKKERGYKKNDTIEWE